MEPLLQAHVIAPSGEAGRQDELIELFYEHGLRAANDGYLDADRDGFEVASTLFEDRPDNRETLRELRAAIQDLFDDGDVFCGEHEHTFGELLSTGEPHYHVVFEVTNVNDEQSRLRWQTNADTFDAPPRTDDDQVYHADHEGVFALDSITGARNWQTDVPDATRVPKVGDDIVVASGGYSVTALDPTSGDQRWTVEYDRTEENMLSRVAIGRESVFVGFQDGRVEQLDINDGTNERIASFDDSVTQVTVTDAGLLVVVGGEVTSETGTDGTVTMSLADGTLAMLTSDGAVRWQRETPVGDFPPVAEAGDSVYVGTGAGVESMSLMTGEVDWTAELGSGPCLEFVEDHLIVQCSGEIAILDPETGEVSDRVVFSADDPGLFHGHPDRRPGDEYVSTTDSRVLCIDQYGVLHFVSPGEASVEATYDLTTTCGRPTSAGDDAVCVVGEDIVRVRSD